MFSLESLCIYKFVKLLQENKNDIVHFIYQNEMEIDKLDVFVNLEHIMNYTNFFSKKDGFINDFTYNIPFRTDIAEECLHQIHTLFINFSVSLDLFRIIEGFDYFCIDISDIFSKIIIESPKEISIYIYRWTEYVLERENYVLLNYLNILYDIFYEHGFYNFDLNVSKKILKFLITRKWNKKVDMYNIITNAFILEKFLFERFMYYINNNEDYMQVFNELWKYIQLFHLSIETLQQLSNSKIGYLIQLELKDELCRRNGFFNTKNLIKTCRFNIKNEHLKSDEIFINKYVQYLTDKKNWVNGQIHKIIDNKITIIFEDKKNNLKEEIIENNNLFRLLPINTVEKGIICPCNYCLNFIFI
jgi:hypothetical protein